MCTAAATMAYYVLLTRAVWSGVDAVPAGRRRTPATGLRWGSNARGESGRATRWNLLNSAAPRLLKIRAASQRASRLRLQGPCLFNSSHTGHSTPQANSNSPSQNNCDTDYEG